jgi:hypothetical protein
MRPIKENTMKIAKWIVLGVIVLVIGVLAIVWMNLNGIVRRTVQTQSSQQLNVGTALKSASVSLFGGSLGLNNLEIDSPPGFSAPKILTLDDANVKVSYSQLRQDPVHVESVNLKAPKLVVEQAGGKFNFKALMEGAAKTEEKPVDGKPPMKLIIDQLKITDALVVIRPGIPGIAPEINVPLPAISMEKVGTGDGNQNGAELKQVIMEVVTVMASKAADSDKIPPELKMLLQGDLKDVANKLVDARVKKLTTELQKKLPGEAGKALGDVLNDPKSASTNPAGAIEKGLGGLGGVLGGKKPSEPAPAPAVTPAPAKPKKKPAATQPVAQ